MLLVLKSFIGMYSSIGFEDVIFIENECSMVARVYSNEVVRSASLCGTYNLRYTMPFNVIPLGGDSRLQEFRNDWSYA